jgi:hypothetical protein
MADFPCPVPPKPPTARRHCRHYDYHFGPGFGPSCRAGVDLGERGDVKPCMPAVIAKDATCPLREEWTEEERAAWGAWAAHSMARTIVVLAAIPSGPGDTGGTIPCPACGTGTVRFSRAPMNRHLHATCSTPHCFSILQ